MYKNYLKRPFDFLAALFGLIILSPIFIIVTIALFFANQGKPFFFQERYGKDEHIFKIIKFKSMNHKKDKDGNILPDDERLTKVESFVLQSYLDEVPHIIHVI